MFYCFIKLDWWRPGIKGIVPTLLETFLWLPEAQYFKRIYDHSDCFPNSSIYLKRRPHSCCTALCKKKWVDFTSQFPRRGDINCTDIVSSAKITSSTSLPISHGVSFLQASPQSLIQWCVGRDVVLDTWSPWLFFSGILLEVCYQKWVLQKRYNMWTTIAAVSPGKGAKFIVSVCMQS